MKITLPNISVIKMENKCQFVGVMGGVHSSLGAYATLEEGVCKILEKGRIRIIFLTQLELLWRKGMELGWDEEKMFDAYADSKPDGAPREIPSVR